MHILTVATQRHSTHINASHESDPALWFTPSFQQATLLISCGNSVTHSQVFTQHTPHNELLRICLISGNFWQSGYHLNLQLMFIKILRTRAECIDLLPDLANCFLMFISAASRPNISRFNPAVIEQIEWVA
jgi:hypothetical protein